MAFNRNHTLYQEDIRNILSIRGIEEIKNKSFLISGATGLIGVCLIDALMEYNAKGAKINVFAVGRSKEKAKERLGLYFNNDNFHFIEHDVCEPFNFSLHPDYIIPLASNTHPLAYAQYPVETIEINVKGAEHALMTAKDCGATVLYPSSVEIYGNAINQDDFKEDYTGNLNLSNARSCYPESKRLCEALCQSYAKEFDVKVKIVRLSRVFGPTMLKSDTKASSQFINKALENEDIVLKSQGLQYFSYTYVADSVAAMLFVLIHGEQSTAYNICNKQCNIQLRDFAEICANINEKKVIYDLPSEKESAGFSIASRAILDDEKLNNLGFRPFYNMPNAVIRTYKILKDK